MRALTKTGRGPGLLQLREIPEPVARPGWVVVRVAACGICGTDLHIRNDEHRYWPPVVLGHEYVGDIVAVGDGVRGWGSGDRVVCEQHTLACGECDLCRRGAIHLCPEKRSPGWGIDGAFAPYVALPSELLHRVPESVSTLSAAVTEPTAICLTALDRLRLRAGESVAVVGPGPIGLVSAMLARASGGSRVVVRGRSSSSARLAVAADLGFETSFSDAASEPPGAFDAVIEASGTAAGVNAALSMAKITGRVVFVGLTGLNEVSIAFDAAMAKSLSVHFSMSSEYSTWDRALALMAAGRVNPSLLTTVYELEEWEQAFRDVDMRAVVKAVIAPNGKGHLAG